MRNNKEMTFKEINDLYTPLRGGNNAIVYSGTTNHVIRVSMDERDGWRVIPMLTEKTRERLNLPRILRWWWDEKTDYQIAIVERLNKLDYTDYKDNPVDLECFNRYRTPPKNVDEVMAKSNPFYGICTNALRAYHFCNRVGLGINSLDLNHSNIMKRDNGELVLSDPFGSRDI